MDMLERIEVSKQIRAMMKEAGIYGVSEDSAQFDGDTGLADLFDPGGEAPSIESFLAVEEGCVASDRRDGHMTFSTKIDGILYFQCHAFDSNVGLVLLDGPIQF